MEGKRIPHNIPSLIFSIFHEYPVEYPVFLITISINMIVLLILYFMKWSRKYSIIVSILLLAISLSWFYSILPHPLTLGTYGELYEPIPIHSNIYSLSTKDTYFIESDTNRTLLLRGVNLGGSSKIPSTPYQPTYLNHPDFLSGWKDVSFIDRPIPLSEADEHFGRLASCGFHFIRLLTTWEAVEHEGPGIYDYEYLDYLKKLVKVADKYNISCYVDFHQDAWSRFTGGSGAPAWTLKSVGFNLENLHETQAAFLHQKHNGDLPSMVWPTNYGHLATGTMFTIFFAGNEYTPNLLINGEQAQDFLQKHFLGALEVVVNTLKNERNVLGYDLFNEPSEGFVGVEDISSFYWPLRSGYIMNLFDAFQLGSGYSIPLDYYSKSFVYNHTEIINPNNKSAWEDGFNCVWKEHGIWSDENGVPVLHMKDYFKTVPSSKKEPNFLNDFAKPFYTEAANIIHSINEDLLVFIEPTLKFGPLHHTHLHMKESSKFIWAPHWYDGIQLITKSFRNWISVDVYSQFPILNRQRLVESNAAAIGKLMNLVEEVGGNGIPTLIGEIGISMDMQKNLNIPYAYETDDYSLQIEAAHTLLSALDDNIASFSWWCYVFDHNYEHGDNWNGEDLSIFSRDRQKNSSNIFSGGRIFEVLVRPYARKISGIPLYMNFKPFSKFRQFNFKFSHSNNVKSQYPTEIFVPFYQYPFGYHVSISDGHYEVHNNTQTLTYYHDPSIEVHHIHIASINEI